LSSNNVQNFTPSEATLPNKEDNRVAKNMGAREREREKEREKNREKERERERES
jgi:hypothetical protein